MAQQLILVDGSAYLFRSYFSTLSQNLSNDKGFPTGAMFGVINAIKHLQRQYQGSKLIMIFDSKGSNILKWTCQADEQAQLVVYI